MNLKRAIILNTTYYSAFGFCCNQCCCNQQNDIYAWLEHGSTNIVFIKGDIVKTAISSPEDKRINNIKDTKWYFKNSAVVNAANPKLQGGGGVDASIHSCFKNLQKHTEKAKEKDIENNPKKYHQEEEENHTNNRNKYHQKEEKNHKKNQKEEKQEEYLLKESETLVDTVMDIIPTVDYFHFSHIFHTISVHNTKLEKKQKSNLYKQTYKNIFQLAIQNNIEYLFIPCLGTGIWHYPIENAIKEYSAATAEFLVNNKNSLKYIVFVFYPGTKECNKIDEYVKALKETCGEALKEKSPDKLFTEEHDAPTDSTKKFYIPEDAKIGVYGNKVS